MDTSAQIAGIRLQNAILNAAGTCKTLVGKEGLEYFCQSEAGAIMVGSATYEPRSGNSGNTYYTGDGYSLNAIGLTNPGMDAYVKMLPDMLSICQDANKPLFFSVAGFSPEEYASMVYRALQCGVLLVELNLGCPNVYQAKKQKRIASFDLLIIQAILAKVRDKVGDDAPIAVKLSPYSDPRLLETVTELIVQYKMVKALTLCNTFPNGFAFNENNEQSISHLAGLAGMGGKSLKPISLGQIIQVKELAEAHGLQIMGVGGVSSGQDMEDYLRAGAACVQVATACIERGPKVFVDIMSEYVDTSNA
ncbi:MAG: dihydroorotate dehydrogenase [Patescibacteria group bacterium]